MTKRAPASIRRVLVELHKLIADKQPETMDGLIELIAQSGLLADYGYAVRIIRYRGVIQGLRVYVIGLSRWHCLPSITEVYSISQGLQKYLDAGGFERLPE